MTWLTMTPIRLADPEERHEAERGVHHPQTEDRAHHAIGSGGEDQQRLDGVIELEEQRKVNAKHGNRQHQRKVAEAILLLVVLAADGDLVAGRHSLLELAQLGQGDARDLRRQVAGGREGVDRHLAEVIDAHDAVGHHAVLMSEICTSGIFVASC